ncbi:MAG: cell division protein ZapB [Geobacteraceae bacterium]|nr:cell division protein ZapB [Geobacteraceae bacterium]
MDSEIFDVLENRVEVLLGDYASLKRENVSLREEVRKLQQEREDFKARIDVILAKLEGIENL